MQAVITSKTDFSWVLPIPFKRRSSRASCVWMLFQSFVCMDMDEERFCRVVCQPSDLSEQQLCSSLASLEFHPGSCFSDKRVEASPAPAIARNQQVSSLSTRAAGGIVGEVRCRK